MSASILDEIVASKRREVAAGRRRMPLEELEAQAAEAPPIRDFRAALDGRGAIQLIAEVKKASPSVKVIREDFEPVAIARAYQQHGAACVISAVHLKHRLSQIELDESVLVER